MFSGIIEAFGTVKRIDRGKESSVLTIETDLTQSMKKGSSIAVNGVCLTVTSIANKNIILDVMPETISKTNLGNLAADEKVNLERPLAADGRFEGHIVQGHVDGTGVILEKKEVENAFEITVKAPQKVLDLCVEKGSITVDGISFTIVSVDESAFKISMIPYTAQNTSLGQKTVGDILNLEVDILGKYISKFISQLAKDNKLRENLIT